MAGGGALFLLSQAARRSWRPKVQGDGFCAICVFDMKESLHKVVRIARDLFRWIVGQTLHIVATR